MNKYIKLSMIGIIACLFAGCAKVPPGYVGIKVNQYGSQKGVSDFPLKTGMVVYNPFTTEVIRFPTFMQTVIWCQSKTEGSPVDESVSFNSIEGSRINADVTCSFTFEAKKVPNIYIEFREDPKIIMHTYIHNEVRDAFVRLSSTMKAMDILGSKKSKLLDDVKTYLNNKLNPKGFEFDLIGFSGDLRVDPRVTASINAVIQQTQDAIKAEQKVKQVQAEAQQAIAKAEGEQKSKIELAEGDAQSTLLRAQAQAKANDLIAASLSKNPLVLQSIALDKWNGILPLVTGNLMPFLDISHFNNSYTNQVSVK